MSGRGSERSEGAGGALLPNLLHFVRLLRHLGLSPSPRRVRTLARALELTGLERRGDVEAACRCLLVARKEQIPLFDRAFELFFAAPGAAHDRRPELGRPLEKASRRRRLQALGAARSSESPALEIDQPRLELQQSYSASERLRRKDFAELDAEELAAVRRLLRESPLALPPRRSRRTRPSRRGRRLDLRLSLRRSMHRGGELLELAWRQRKEKVRPLVALADISGSMEPYARILLELLYVLAGASERVESFAFATRLTRLTRSLAHRDPNEALHRAADRVRDWGGGTRIGESLKTFNYTWGRRVLGRGAVVLLASDGWDRGDVGLLEREVARLARSSDSLIWLNPLLGSPGYQPLTRGIRAVLPHVDHFLPVHNLESLDQLGRVLAELGAPGPTSPEP